MRLFCLPCLILTYEALTPKFHTSSFISIGGSFFSDSISIFMSQKYFHYFIQCLCFHSLLRHLLISSLRPLIIFIIAVLKPLSCASAELHFSGVLASGGGKRLFLCVLLQEDLSI